jgi:hypothetical protein
MSGQNPRAEYERLSIIVHAEQRVKPVSSHLVRLPLLFPRLQFTIRFPPGAARILRAKF